MIFSIEKCVSNVEIQDRLSIKSQRSSFTSASFHNNKRNHYIRYKVIPGCSKSLIPNASNFSVNNFAPDLSKVYCLNQSCKDQMDKHLIQRSCSNRMCHIYAKSKEVSMLIIWLMVWVISFEYVDDIEKQFRVEQMCSIMHNLFLIHNISQKDLILQDVFQTVLDFGTFSMIEELYELLKLLNIKGNATIDNIFFNAIRKHNEIIDLQSKLLINEEEEKQENSDIDIDLSSFFIDPANLNTSLNLPNRIKSYSFEDLKLKTHKSFDKSKSEKKHICPDVHKEIEYDSRKTRMKRYFNSTILNSEYYISSKLKFRKRTFKNK